MLVPKLSSRTDLDMNLSRTIFFTAPLIMLALGVLTGFAPEPSKSNEPSESENSPTELESKKKKIMCSWFSQGKTQFMCLETDMKSAQKKCDEKASAERGDTATCTCTDSADYIRDTCD